MSSVNEKSIGNVVIPINTKLLTVISAWDANTQMITIAARNPIGDFVLNGSLVKERNHYVLNKIQD